MKRQLENAYDFSFKKAFNAIDDWSYGYVDKTNLKRFLRSMSHVATKRELVAILRRLDLDGDAKINFKEFEIALKSSLTAYPAPRRQKSVSNVQQYSPRHSTATPKSGGKARPQTAGKLSNRKRENELACAKSGSKIGPNSNYFLTQQQQP